MIAEAIIDHRASLEYEARSVYGKLVSSADREISVENMLERSINFQSEKHKEESPTINQVIEYSFKKLSSKYGKGGYAKMYFPDEKYEEYLKIKLELNRNYGDDKEKQRKLDLLNYQVNEIEIANLKIDEEDELESKRKIMMASEKISTSIADAENQISNVVIDSLNSAIKSIEKVEQYNQDFAPIIERLKNAYYEIQEVSYDITSFSEEMYYDDHAWQKENNPYWSCYLYGCFPYVRAYRQHGSYLGCTYLRWLRKYAYHR